jgi:hypothetical protein
MYRHLNRLCRVLLLISLLNIVTISDASWWNRKKPEKIETLIITSNYIKSRIVAELLMIEKNQPILLLSTDGEKDKIYCLFPHSRDGLVVKKVDFVKFVNYLHPKNVVFLGNEQYVPTEYKDLLNDRTTWSVTGNDWNNIAVSVGSILRYKRLWEDYLVNINQLDEHGQIKPPATTGEIKGFLIKEEYWTPFDPDAQ